MIFIIICNDLILVERLTNYGGILKDHGILLVEHLQGEFENDNHMRVI